MPERKILDMEDLRKIPNGTIFSKGEVVDGPEGINIDGSGKMLKYVAVKGWANDWAVYVHLSEEHDYQFVRSYGNKVIGSENIRRAVPCTDEVLGRYRY